MEHRTLLAVDLVPGGMTLGGYDASTASITIVDRLTNIGDTPAPGGVVIRYMVSDDETLSPNDVLAREVRISRPVPAGGTVQFSRTLDAQWYWPNDRPFLIVLVNPRNPVGGGGFVDESDRSNNVLTGVQIPVAEFGFGLGATRADPSIVRPFETFELTTNAPRRGGQGLVAAVYRSGFGYLGNAVLDRATGLWRFQTALDAATLGSERAVNAVYSFSLPSFTPFSRATGVAVSLTDLQHPTLGAVNVAPDPLVRGNEASVQVSGLPATGARVQLIWDSNFDGRFESFIDQVLTQSFVHGSSGTLTFTVPMQWPQRPVKLLIFVTNAPWTGFAQRIVELSARG